MLSFLSSEILLFHFLIPLDRELLFLLSPAFLSFFLPELYDLQRLVHQTLTVKNDGLEGEESSRTDMEVSTTIDELKSTNEKEDENGDLTSPPEIMRTAAPDDEDAPSVDHDSGVDRGSSDDGAAKLARKNARTLAAEKRRAEVEARKADRENVS